MDTLRDYYAELGLTDRASPEEIKHAFRSIARRLHPDHTGNDPEAEARFRAVAEAYSVLSDPRRRSMYDVARGKPTQPPEEYEPADVNHYEVLGIDESAGISEIRSAFLRQREQSRLQATEGDERTRAIFEAYRVLADPDRRLRFDRALSKRSRQRAPR